MVVEEGSFDDDDGDKDDGCGSFVCSVQNVSKCGLRKRRGRGNKMVEVEMKEKGCRLGTNVVQT